MTHPERRGAFTLACIVLGLEPSVGYLASRSNCAAPASLSRA
jgi:hypothetical protein